MVMAEGIDTQARVSYIGREKEAAGKGMKLD
jgi:hypothetical protein